MIVGFRDVQMSCLSSESGALVEICASCPTTIAMSVGDTTSCGALKPLIDDGPKSPAIVGGSATLQPATTATTAPAKRSLIRMPEQETENVPPNGGWLELVDPNLRLLAMGDGRWAMGDGRWAMGDDGENCSGCDRPHPCDGLGRRKLDSLAPSWETCPTPTSF